MAVNLTATCAPCLLLMMRKRDQQLSLSSGGWHSNIRPTSLCTSTLLLRQRQFTSGWRLLANSAIHNLSCPCKSHNVLGASADKSSGLRNAKRDCPVITTTFLEAQSSYRDTSLIFIFDSFVFISPVPIQCLSSILDSSFVVFKTICLPIVLSLSDCLPICLQTSYLCHILSIFRKQVQF